MRLTPIVGDRGSHCVCAKAGPLLALGGVAGPWLVRSLSGVRSTLLVGDLGSAGPALDEQLPRLAASSSDESKVHRREY